MRLLASAILCSMLAASAQAASTDPTASLYPGKAWDAGDARSLGWSVERLAAARAFFEGLPPASVVVVDRGRKVIAWGDEGRRIKVSSMRKSLLSALYGIYTPQSSLRLDATLAELGIDDDPPLSPSERHATVRMLLESRSGVYHAYVAGTPAMRAHWPERGSHAPGSFWFYNNWDFNALGTIFEQQFHTRIASAFRERIASPLDMQDFRTEDMYYLQAPANARPDVDKSIHPAYHFRLSVRDVARFGYLFLRHGEWNGKRVVPSDWVDESTRSHSVTSRDEGYGYLWWVDGFGLPQKSFSAQGALAKYLVVVPERDLVVAYLNYTEFPDDASALSEDDVKKLPTISHEQMAHFLRLILSAQRP